MSKRRTHSTIDKLPKPLRQTLTAMAVDNLWPDSFPRISDTPGTPTYDDMVAFCKHKGFDVSRSAVGRFAKQLQVFERMKTAGVIARDVMTGLTDEDATKTQKAAAEIITAQIIDLASSEDMSAKDIKNIATAIRDCTQVAMKADTYIREQTKEKVKKAEKQITAIAKKKKIDPETLKAIRQQVYGIID